MSGSLRRSPFVLALTIVLVAGACATPGASSPGASPAESAGESPAASGPEESTVTGAACQAGATEVQFWTEHTPPASDTMASIVDAFNQANPDVCVKMTIVPGSETDITKLLTAIRGGAAPDVYMADRFTVPQRASEGVLAELPEAGALQSQYLEFAWNETQFQGKTYALPFDTDARALFYNKDMIEAAGEDPATLDIANGPPTIDEVLAIADKITKEDADGNYETMGWIPGGPGPAGQPGAHRPGLALHVGLRARWQLRRHRSLHGDADRPGRRGRLPVPVRLRERARSRQDQPLRQHQHAGSHQPGAAERLHHGQARDGRDR